MPLGREKKEKAERPIILTSSGITLVLQPAITLFVAFSIMQFPSLL